MISHSNRLSSFDRNICDIDWKGHVLNKTSTWWFNKTRHIIDIIACIAAKRFVGTALSTFSYYIQILRGYLSRYYTQIDDTPIFIQSDSRNLIKDNDKWTCPKGCWNMVDTHRWKKL